MHHIKTTLALTAGVSFLVLSNSATAGYYDDNQFDSLSKLRQKLILHIQNDGPEDDAAIIDIVPFNPNGPPSFWTDVPGISINTNELDFKQSLSGSPGPSGDSTFFTPDPSPVPWTSNPLSPGDALDLSPDWLAPFDPGHLGHTTGSAIPTPGVLSLVLLAGLGARRRRTA